MLLPLLEVDAIAEDDGAVQSQARLRVVPGDEFADGVLSLEECPEGRECEVPLSRSATQPYPSA
jgi:hypothetical protein